MKNKEELKPCPFCGYEDPLLSNHDDEIPDDPYAENWRVDCCHCGASPICDLMDKQNAIKAWNTRADLCEGNNGEALEVFEAIIEVCESEAECRVHDLLNNMPVTKGVQIIRQALTKQLK